MKTAALLAVTAVVLVLAVAPAVAHHKWSGSETGARRGKSNMSYHAPRGRWQRCACNRCRVG